MILVIMAAGLGSRFGGLKQVEPVGPYGEFIIDYSIYDAIKAGFTKVIFIIKEENYELFRETIGKRIEGKIKVEYAFQSLEILPSNIVLPKTRTKPLGTAHALYCAQDLIDEPFVVISADDLYGREAFEELAQFLKKSKDCALVGYKIGHTLTKIGSVKRGVCFEERGMLTHITESKVERVNGEIIGTPLIGKPIPYKITEEQTVSMLMFGLHPYIFDYLNKDIITFFKSAEDLDNCEYYLPQLLEDMLQKRKINMHILKTNAIWKGVTYSQDLNDLKKYIKEQIANNIYPDELYK